MGILEEIKNIFSSESKKDSNSHSFLRNIIIMGILGISLLLFSNLFLNNDIYNNNSKQQQATVTIPTPQEEYEEKLANDLEELISLIKGVGLVKVKVYARSDSEYQYEYNKSTENKITQETDQDGGKRQINEDNIESNMVIIRDSAGNEKPVVKNTRFPEITGILIVAEGADVGTIKYQIIRAVSSLLDLPVHKISVLPYERR